MTPRPPAKINLKPFFLGQDRLSTPLGKNPVLFRSGVKRVV